MYRTLDARVKNELKLLQDSCLVTEAVVEHVSIFSSISAAQ